MIPETQTGRETTDETLTTKAQSGDRNAFDLLVERHFGAVYAVAYARLQNHEAAEDLAQEAFLRAYLFLPRLREIVNFPNWVTRVARNLSIDWLRRRQTSSRLLPLVSLTESHMDVPDTKAMPPPGRIADDEQKRAVHQALAKLPPEQREILLLHYMEDLSLKEIALRQGVHPSTAGRRHEEALRRIRGVLEPVLRDSIGSLRPLRKAAGRTLGIVAAVSVLSPAAKSALAAKAAETLSFAAASKAAAATTGITLDLLLEGLISALKTGGTIMATGKGITIAVATVVVLGGGGVYLATQGGNGPSASRMITQPQSSTSPSAPPSWAPAGPYQLASKLPVGKKLIIRSELHGVAQLDLPPALGGGAAHPQNTYTGQTLEMAISGLAQRPDGGADLEAVILSLQMITEVGGKETVHFDSRNPTSPGSTEAGAAASAVDLAPIFAAHPVRFSMDSTGKVESMQGIQELLGALGPNVPTGIQPLLATLINEDALKRTVYRNLPAKAVQPGDTWTVDDEIRIPTMGGTLTTHLNYRLAGWEEHNSRHCARLNYEGTIRPSGPLQGPGARKFDLTELKTSGTEWFDIELGCLVDSEATQNMIARETMRIPGQAQEQVLNAKIRQNLTSELVRIENLATVSEPGSGN